MPIQLTLEKVQNDIDTGNLGKARDRLHGLINTYPNDLGLRVKLGDIYWRLQLPEMAGRYWYLEENKSEQVQSACQFFEKTCKNNPLEILRMLKFKGSLEPIKDKYSGKKLQELIKNAETSHPWYKASRSNFSTNQRVKAIEQKKHKTRNKVFSWLFIAFLFILLCFIGIGIVSIIKWVFNV